MATRKDAPPFRHPLGTVDRACLHCTLPDCDEGSPGCLRRAARRVQQAGGKRGGRRPVGLALDICRLRLAGAPIPGHEEAPA